MPSSLQENLRSVRIRINASAAASGRDPRTIGIVAVSKTHPTSLIREAMAAGINVFGENKVQEAEGKIAEIGRQNARWHLIGHLQANKARKAVQLFDVIHSVDSLELATRLERICREEGRESLSVLAQIDLAGEETKSGIHGSELPEFAEFLRTCKCLSFDGLMLLPPYFEDPESTRPFFKQLREIRDNLQADGAFGEGEGQLSMGMSHDFEIAIEEGATLVRVGTAIFGERSKAIP